MLFGEKIHWPKRRWFSAVGFTAAVICLLTVSFGALDVLLLFYMMVTILCGVTLLYWLFPGSRLLSLAFANYLAIYVCLFSFFVEENFNLTALWALHIGFVLPIVAFLGGVWWRRQEIADVLKHDQPRPDGAVRSEGDHRHLGRLLLWLIPIFAVGALTFLLPWTQLETAPVNTIFLGSMAVLAIIIFLVSRDVCAFMIETGLLFEGFFQRIARLAAPIFAFFTFYSFTVIIFAAFYRVVDRFTPGVHFEVGGIVRDITLQESLYFSLVTLSTLGYGDILPLSSVTRVLVSLEIVTGVLLLLFGFSEIIAFSRERQDRSHNRSHNKRG